MKARTLALALTLLAATTFVVLPAAADVYTVKLTSGKSFLTRYQPREASFDPALVTFLDDQGNQIAVPRDQIDEITSTVETKGYGLRINTTTIMLGYTANNGVIEGNQVVVSGEGNQSFDIQQFVEPGEAGGGVPVFGGPFGGITGSSSGGSAIGPAVPQPSATPPPAPVDSGGETQ